MLAESDTYEVIEGNIYFPPKTTHKEFFVKVILTRHVRGREKQVIISSKLRKKKMLMRFYPEPKEAAKNIRSHGAFWKGIRFSNKIFLPLISKHMSSDIK